jgi:pimeloyl-ACP methyl ester carboxylesterase
MRHAGKTPPFRGANGELLPDSVAEAKYLRIGGIHQWVMFRGRDIANPPLIMLHGGPGMSEMRFFRHFNASLEDVFTVVHWDQRGTGKSFSRKVPESSMTVEQFVSDLDEIVDIVRTRFGAEKVAIFGHSWGSLLGALYAARFPTKVSVYVGAAQIADAAAAEAASYGLAVAAARRQRNRQALRKLRKIGPPPYDGKAVITERMTMQKLDGQLTPRLMLGTLRVLFGGESSLLDAPALYRGFRFSLDAMWRETSALDLNKLVPKLEVPVFFFLGRNDRWVPPETTVPYFDALEAPSKTLVWFEQSGHEMFVDEPSKFNEVMRDRVRPLLDVQLPHSEPRWVTT